jgi:xanthine dehydrogenase small subunit
MKVLQNRIQFVLDAKVHEVIFDGSNGIKPSTTVLNYLRSLREHKGVKEGCAEGDCGACTIVVAESGEESALRYMAIDSCLLFLPMIHGKQIITVENLAEKNNHTQVLHPVQQSMVDLHGSQCGYCTPGIVMSLFALYKNHHQPERVTVEDALTGNLCRCTGYRPIVDAAMHACTQHGKDHFTTQEAATAKVLKAILQEHPSVHIETANQRYYRPSTIQEVLELREQFPTAVVFSGATDVALRQTKKHEHFDIMLDLSGIRELQQLAIGNDAITIGSGVVMERIRQASKGLLPALYEMLNVFASLQIRNIASIGGNLGSASPIGDSLPVLMACKAELTLVSKRGERITGMEEFIKGYRSTDLQADELISSVRIPFPAPDAIIRFYKVSKRKDLDISTVSACFRIQKNSDGRITDLILAYGGMAECTRRATKTEMALLGKEWNEETVEKACAYITHDFEPISDARSGKEFRSLVAGNLLLKFYHDTTELLPTE